jgi:predicted PurR-regulated permease PerM
MANSPYANHDSLIRAALIIGVLASLCIFAPYAGVAVASIWAAQLARPVMETSVRLLGGRQRAGAAVTVMIVIVMVAPVAVVAMVAVTAAREVVHRLQESPTVLALYSNLRAEAGDSAVRAAQLASRSATRIVIAAALFVVGTYTCLVDARRARAWVFTHLPFNEEASARLEKAFEETGRGLLVGVFLTALAQGIVATLVYVGIGVPHPILFGGLTFLAAFVPLVGTSIVWVPLAISLAIEGRMTASVALAVLGLLGVGTIDNLLRPYFARYGRLTLPTWVLALSMFGGLALIGFQGLFLGPLIVRLTKELLAIYRGEPA